MEYVYRCPKGHEFEVVHGMHDVIEVYCPECGQKSRKKPLLLRVNWGGLRPSQGELSRTIKEHIEKAPAERERIMREQEDGIC